MTDKDSKAPGELLKSLDNPLGTVRTILEGSVEQALSSPTKVPLPADSGISAVSYPVLMEGLLKGLESFLEGEDLDLLSMKSTKRVVFILETLLGVGVPEGKSFKDIAPDFRLLCQDLLMEDVSPASFVYSDIYLKLRDTDLEEIQNFISAREFRSAEHFFCKIDSSYWAKDLMSPKDSRDLLGTIKKLLAYLDGSAANLDLNGSLWLLWELRRLKHFNYSIYRASNENLRRYLQKHFSGTPSHIPGGVFSYLKKGALSSSYSNLLAEFVSFKMNLERVIEVLEKKKGFYSDDHVIKVLNSLKFIRFASEALEKEGIPPQGPWSVRE